MKERLLEHGGGSQNPELIVVHAMAEFLDYEGERLHAVDFLDRIGLSAHMLVEPDGTLIRCRADVRIAWHAKGFNENSLGIEVLVPGVYSYEPFLQRIVEPWVAKPQIEATAAQIRQWCADWPIKRIEGHCHIDGARKRDPGSGFAWGRLMALLAAEKAA